MLSLRTAAVLLTSILVLGTFQAWSQTQRDSIRLYKQLEIKSKRHRLTKLLFENVVRTPTPRVPPKAARFGKAVNPANPFDASEGKIIRSVQVNVLDPFGHSVNDTARQPSTPVERYGNNVHVTSKAYLIRNQLLFKKGQALDPLKMSESERILRQAPYINDAHIYIKSLPDNKAKNADSVDVWIWVQDNWSILPGSSFNPYQPNLILTERNFLGMGGYLRQNFAYSIPDDKWSFAGQYGIFNLRRSFLSAYFIYQVSPDINSYGITLDRPFFSPLTRWAGGLSILRTYSYFHPIPPVYPLPDSTLEVKRYPITFDVYDGWLGKSWQLEKGNSIERRSTALVASGRIIYTKFFERPGSDVDIYTQNTTQTTYLGSFGISKRGFYKEKYLYRFGANEDVPIGYSLQVIGGFQQTELQPTQFYSGISGSAGSLFRTGYYALHLGYGNFYNKSGVNRGVVQGNLNYFSRLMSFGKWGIRQFVSLNTVIGLNRRTYEYIDLNGSQLYGFNSPTIRGKSKAILNLETVFYMPYNVLGFRFAPVLIIGLGKIGADVEEVLSSPIYPAFSIGLLVRNENLVFQTFELSIGIYPYQPGSSATWYRLNPVTSYRLKVRDFALPKPEVLGYN